MKSYDLAVSARKVTDWSLSNYFYYPFRVIDRRYQFIQTTNVYLKNLIHYHLNLRRTNHHPLLKCWYWLSWMTYSMNIACYFSNFAVCSIESFYTHMSLPGTHVSSFAVFFQLNRNPTFNYHSRLQKHRDAIPTWSF